MENKPLIPKSTSLWDKLKQNEKVKQFFLILLATLGIAIFIVGLCYLGYYQEEKDEESVPDITIPSMEFTVLNMTETRLGVKWDLLIRIPPLLPGFYACLEGDFKVFIVYKGVIIATSPIESYTLKPWWPKLLKVSLIASEEDMDGAIVKNIVEEITERGEMRFGSRLLLPDCRYGSSGKMNYACDEATLRFEPGSLWNATLFGNQPNCHYLL